MNKLLALAIEASRAAGDAIMCHYQKAQVLELKFDGSPLTLADQAAHIVISRYLHESGLVIVSEEGEDLHLNTNRYWLVDPLDGTKDFLTGNGEFTINIALVEDGRPVLGVVFAPALNDLYWGGKGMSAWRIQNGVEVKLPPLARSHSPRMVVSRFHDHPDIKIFAGQNRIVSSIPIGSALKYCLLASGGVDVFPRLVGSSEWDTAAGQAVLEGAGGLVLDWHKGEALQYGKLRRRNPRLIAIRAPYLFEEFKLKEYEAELL